MAMTATLPAEDKFAETRHKVFEESLENSNQPRWGYFGLCGTLAIGDNSFAPPKVRKPKDEADSGEPLRQVQCQPLRRGAGPDIYFKFETSVGIGDPYTDPGAAMRKGKVKMLDPEAAFKPPGKVKAPVNKLGYEYVDHKDTMKDPVAVKEKYKDYMPKRQILSNPAKKGGAGTITPGFLFGTGEERKYPEFLPDDYEAARKLRNKEMEEHKAKLQETPFRAMDYGNKMFFDNTTTYKCDQPTHIPKEPKPENFKVLQHEAAFRPANPSKKGVPQALMGDYPEWMPEPARQATRKPKPADGEEKTPFRLNAPLRNCNPMPSVVCNTSNLRRERPSSFVRPCL